MSFRVTRLGVGEWLVLAASAGLLADLFAGSWFSYPAGSYPAAAGAIAVHATQTGWRGLPWLGPATVVVAGTGIAIGAAQMLRRSPALPLVLTTLLTPVAAALAVALAVRTLIAPPDGAPARAGAGSALSVDAAGYVGLGLAVVLAVGLYVALRREGVAAQDGPGEIETISLGAPGV